ncbi:MAG TPA: phenylalanine--tRNA ligase subunit beta [Gemmatimonadaceae bacterium]|jgi:phenylalanyl-tRNA synthetase beta chain|nr:phenylalanine--tRNA ligase subunit beta [Gemmatimonadaceae bacterium]
MNASLEWLSAFVDSGLSGTQMRDLLTARVATVDAVEALRADLAPIVVGEVLTAERHPDSDHLWITTVDVGGEAPLDVICGAPNVRVGVRYPFAPVGATMPDGMRIERRKIRGRLSNGMLCSARELGLGTEHEGILPLHTTAAPGTPLLDAVALGDVRLVIDVTPNRPDLLSHRGLGREIAAAVGRPLVVPDKAADLPDPRANGTVPVRVDHPDDAPTFVAIALRNVRVGPSPEWLVRRLAAVGVRSINNVVDITNYMLHGYGQPTHAYDLDRLTGGLTVRRARSGERLVTLDGDDRLLDASMIVIADDARAQGLAGVMGGHDSEVTGTTTRMLLEMASFSPSRVRRTARALGLSTDASYRFERGVPPELPLDVAPIAVALLQSLAGASVEGVPTAVTRPREPKVVPLRPARIERFLGIPIPVAEVDRLLSAIGFRVEESQNGLLVTVPWFRSDVTAEVDLLEEVARLRGYDSFPADLRPYRPTTTVDAPAVAVADRVRETLVALGLYEARPIPFVADAGPEGVKVRNPLAENEAYLRSDLLTPLARRAEHNLRHMTGDIRLFEVGTVFRRGDARPVEEVHVAALIMGARRPPHFTEPHPPVFDEWDARGIAERLASTTFPAATIELAPGLEDTDVLWHVRVDNTARGAVRRLTLDAPPWAAPTYGVELCIEKTPTDAVAPPGHHAYGATGGVARHVPRYVAPPSVPAVERDVTLLVRDDLVGGAGAVGRVLGGEFLESSDVVNEYRGPGVPDGVRAVTWRLTFRHPTRTLTEKEVDAAQRKLLRTLETELGVRQRSA